MNRFLNYFLSMSMIAALLAVTSCGEDTDPIDAELNPTLELAGADADQMTFDVGEEINLTFNFDTPRELSSFNVYTTVDGVELATDYNNPETDLGMTANETVGAINYTAVIPAEWEGSTVNMVFEVVDQDNESAEVVFDFTVNEVALTEYETVLLGGQLHGTEESFFNAVDGVEYGYSAAKSNPDQVDFIYYYVSEGTTPPQNTIGAPANQATKTTWASTTTSSGQKLTLPADMDNATQFKKVTTTTYEEIVSGSQLVNAYVENANTANTRITNLQVGETFAFQLDERRGGRYGVVEVANISGTQGSNREITLNVKVQAEDN